MGHSEHDPVAKGRWRPWNLFSPASNGSSRSLSPRLFI